MINILPFRIRQIVLLILGYGLSISSQSYAQGIALDSPKAPLIRLIDDHYRHPIGTGFLLELDLEALPAWEGTLQLQPVQSVYHAYESRGGASPSHRRASSFFPFSRGVGGILSIGRRAKQLPLPMQMVFPLDSTVVLDSTGMLIVKRNSPRQLRFLVPQYVATDNRAIYFVLHDEVLHDPFRYVRSPVLHLDSLLPDIDIQLVASRPGRHLGAQGQWVTIAYQPPPYFLIKNDSIAYLTPHILLNQQYEVPDPREFRAWWDVTAHPDSLTCFVPDAVAQADGTIELEMRLGYGDELSLKSRQPILLKGSNAAPRMALRITEIEKKHYDKKSPFTPYTDYHVMMLMGGTRLGVSGRASASRSDHQFIRWDEYPPIEIPVLPGDSIGMRISAYDGLNFTTDAVLFRYLPLSRLPQSGGIFELKYRFRYEGERHHWIIRGEYTALKEYGK